MKPKDGKISGVKQGETEGHIGQGGSLKEFSREKKRRAGENEFALGELSQTSVIRKEGGWGRERQKRKSAATERGGKSKPRRMTERMSGKGAFYGDLVKTTKR